MLEKMMILLVSLLSIDVCIAYAAAFIPGPSGFVFHVRPGIYVYTVIYLLFDLHVCICT